jgi:hypothetical protein
VLQGCFCQLVSHLVLNHACKAFFHIEKFHFLLVVNLAQLLGESEIILQQPKSGRLTANGRSNLLTPEFELRVASTWVLRVLIFFVC